MICRFTLQKENKDKSNSYHNLNVRVSQVIIQDLLGLV